MRWSFVLSSISSFTLKGGFEQQRSRPPPAAETGRRGWGSAPLFQSPAKGLQKKRQAQLVRPAVQSGGQKSPSATATTAASGRSREELLGLRPAGCACRPRHDAAAGSRDPGSFLFCAARDIHPRPPKNLNVSRCIPLFLFHLSLKAALPCRVTKKRRLAISREASFPLMLKV